MKSVVSDQSSVISTGLRRPGIRPLRLLFLFVMSVLVFSSTSSSAAPKHPPVIVVIANHISLDDLVTGSPNAAHLLEHSAIALVNTGPQHRPAIEARYLAMAAGVRAIDAGAAVNFYESGETLQGRSAGEVYAEQMGGGASTGSAVCIGFPKLLRENEQPAFREECIGLVGDAFHKAGLLTAAIGNSDTPDKPFRLAPLLAMDSKGVVDTGVIGADALKKAPLSLCGVRDDPKLLSSLVSKMLEDHSLVVVELGGFNRLEALRGDISDRAYESYRGRCMSELDKFLWDMAMMAQWHRGVLILCSPVRAQSKGYWSNLSPMLMFGHGVRHGLLISATARTPGLLSNIDVGPTIIQAAGLKVPDFVTGRPALAVSAEQPVKRLQRLERIATRNNDIQIPVLVGVAILVVLSATLSEIVLRGRGRAWMRKALRAALLVSFTLPAALLLADGVEGSGIVVYLMNLGLGIAAVFAASWIVTVVLTALRRGKPVVLPGVVFGLTAALIAVDVLTGARLLRWSIASCDQITGIRYYGLGNEYMGLLIGSALVGAALLMRGSTVSNPKELACVPTAYVVPVVAWFAFTAFVIGYPAYGANVGGLLTAVPAFGTAIMALMGMRIRARHVLGLLALGFVAVAGCAVVDILSPGIGGSHLGRSIELARIYGWDWLGYLIGGKILMHLGILRLPQTYYPLLCSIPFFVMYGGRMKSEMVEAGKTDLLYRAGVPSVLAGMATALLFNDSGVVPASFIMAVFVLVVQYLRLTEDRV